MVIHKIKVTTKAALVAAFVVLCQVLVWADVAPPNNLHAKAANNTSIAVAWDRTDTTATAYLLERQEGAGSFLILEATLPSKSNIYLDRSVKPGTTYTYRVTALNGGGPGVASATVSATTPAANSGGQPDPTGLTVSKVTGSPTSLLLHWTDNHTGTNFLYQIERSLDGVKFVPVVCETYGYSYDYTDLELTPNQTYYYRVRCVSSNILASNYTAVVSQTTNSRTGGFPVEPTGLVATAVNTDGQHIDLHWTNPGGAVVEIESAPFVVTGSPIYYGSNADGMTYTALATTGAGDTTYHVSGLSPEHAYWFRIRTVTGGNHSQYAFPVACQTSSVGHAATYDIGTGKTYPTIGSFDWSLPGAGDTVRIFAHPDGSPYHDMFFISTAGTDTSPVTVIGVPDPTTGALPVFDGTGATTDIQFAGIASYTSVLGGMITVEPRSATGDGGSAIPGFKPRNIVIDTLKVQNCYWGDGAVESNSATWATFTKAGGASFPMLGIGIYIPRGGKVTVQNCEVVGNTEGIFCNGRTNFAQRNEGMYLYNNYVHGNSTTASDKYHEIYTESDLLIATGNNVGASRGPHEGGGGFKDRSTRTQIAYNRIVPSGHALDLVEAQTTIEAALGDPGYGEAFVWGNLFLSNDSTTQYQLHWGNDGSGEASSRRGILYYWNNTFIDSTNNGVADRVVMLSNDSASNIFDIRNNAFYSVQVSGPYSPAFIVGLDNTISYWGKNYVARQGYHYVSYNDAVTPGSFTGIWQGSSNLVMNGAASPPTDTSDNPGFVSVAPGSQNANIATGSILIGASGPLSGAETAYTFDKQYKFSGPGTASRADGNDLGAFKYSGSSESISSIVTSIPANHNGTLDVPITGSGTAWNGSTMWTASNGSGYTLSSVTVNTGTTAVLHFTLGAVLPGGTSATGPITVTDGTANIIFNVVAPSITLSTNTASIGQSLTLTISAASGSTLWTHETASGLFAVSGGTSPSIGTPTVSGDTSATATFGAGTTAGTVIVTDTSTGASASITVGMSFTLFRDYTASLPDSVVGGANTTSGAGWNFKDVKGGIYYLLAGTLQGIPTATDDYHRAFLIPPTTENSRDQQIAVDLAAPVTTSNATSVHMVARYVDSSNFYLGSLVYYTTANPHIHIYKYVAGVLSSDLVASTSTTLVNGHTYRLMLSAVGASPTTLTYAVRDNTTSTVVSTLVATDSEGALQVASPAGLSLGYTGAAQPVTITRIRTYYSNTNGQGMTGSPEMMISGSNQTYSLIGQNTVWNSSPPTFSFTQTGSSASIVGTPAVGGNTTASFVVNPGTNGGTMVVNDSNGNKAFLVVQAPSISVSPLSVNTSTTTTITLTGVLTTWNSGSNTPVITVDTGTITSQTVNSATSITLHYASGASPGVITLTDPSSGATTTVSVMQFYNVADSHIFFSPYTWYKSASTYAQAISGGSYLKTSVSGTSCSLGVDVSMLVSGSVAAQNYPIIRYSVDNGPYVDYQLTPASTKIPLFSGLSNTTHSLMVRLNAIGASNDRWVTPVSCLRVTDIDVDGTLVNPTLLTKRLLVYWDSIGEAKHVDYITGGPDLTDASQSAVIAMAAGLNAEYGPVCLNGTGYTVGFNTEGTVPLWTSSNASLTSWNQYSNGKSRLVSGLLSPQPDYVICPLGTNDNATSDATVRATVTGFMTDLRAAATSAQIYIVIPPSQRKATAITNGFNDYTAAHAADASVYLLNLGTVVQQGMPGLGLGTYGSIEGLHSNGAFNAIVAAITLQLIGGSTGSVVSGTDPWATILGASYPRGSAGWYLLQVKGKTDHIH